MCSSDLNLDLFDKCMSIHCVWKFQSGPWTHHTKPLYKTCTQRGEHMQKHKCDLDFLGPNDFPLIREGKKKQKKTSSSRQHIICTWIFYSHSECNSPYTRVDEILKKDFIHQSRNWYELLWVRSKVSIARGNGRCS